MIKINKIFPKGRRKVFTLSYDDGITQDRRLVQLFNKYNLKATFNLNSGLQNEAGSFILNDLLIKRMNRDEICDLYKGHEIAIHGLTHLSLTDIPKELVLEEILQDKKNHEALFNYPVRGMAYPYGTYSKEVLEVMKCVGVEYSRTVNNHENFWLPSKPLEWDPTCHHSNPSLMKIAKKFIDGDFFGLGLFYLWGHSYEFDLDNNWKVIEELCEYISGKDDIWYATNIEIIDYLEAWDRLKISSNFTFAYNPSAISLWVEFNEIPIEIKPGETKNFE